MISKVEGTYWPKSNMPLWRYLSFDKFVNLLLHRELQFTRASLFTDQNELRLLGGAADQRPGKSEDLEDRIQRLRYKTYISCWSLGKSESYPLWKIYLGGARNGVAIRTTVGRLCSTLNDSPSTFFTGGVQYRGSAFVEMPTDAQLICTKHEAYTYEREFRVFTHKSLSSEEEQLFAPNVVAESVQLDQLIRWVYVSPFSSSWFEDTVRHTISKLAPGLSFEIRNSHIRDQ